MTIEKQFERVVCSRGFLYSFILATAAAFIGGYRSRGFAIMALPLLAWSPFLLAIALHLGVVAIRRIRDREGTFISEAWLPLGWIILTVYIAYFAICMLLKQRELGVGCVPYTVSLWGQV